jgi:anti-sigma regulatory factor (Ser/Thr protein kinase)
LSKFSCDAELRIPSDFIYLRSVRAFIRELAENMGFCPEKVRNIEIATDEIFSNAVEHGSTDTQSEILICCSTNDEMVRITISDNGRGKTIKEKWIKVWSDINSSKIKIGTERGHGLLLAHLLTDEMHMESNSAGGLDVQLLWFIGEDSLCSTNTNRVLCEPQVCLNSTG